MTTPQPSVDPLEALYDKADVHGKSAIMVQAAIFASAFDALSAPESLRKDIISKSLQILEYVSKHKFSPLSSNSTSTVA